MLNWGAVDRILWMGVLCLVVWCVAIWDQPPAPLRNSYVPQRAILHTTSVVSDSNYQGLEQLRYARSCTLKKKIVTCRNLSDWWTGVREGPNICRVLLNIMGYQLVTCAAYKWIHWMRHYSPLLKETTFHSSILYLLKRGFMLHVQLRIQYITQSQRHSVGLGIR
jgi:hypothetical protein